MLQQIDNKTETVRYIRRKRNEEVVGSDAIWDRFKVRDVVNTEVCEQTFAHFQKFKAVCRRMDRATMVLFIFRMMIIHNEVNTTRLKKKAKNPAPGTEASTHRVPSATQSCPWVMGRTYV